MNSPKNENDASWFLTTDLGTKILLPCSPWRYEFVVGTTFCRVYCENVVYMVEVEEGLRLLQQSRVERTARILQTVFKERL